MQDMVIIDELHVSRLEIHDHCVGATVGLRLHPRQSLDRQGGQAGGVGVALRGEDVGGDEADEQAVSLAGEDGDHVPSGAVRALFAPGVIGLGLVEFGGEVGALPHQLVVQTDGIAHRR